MAENKEHPARGSQDKVELSEGQRGKGVQVIQTAGLPENFVPPSASLAPPAADASGDGGSGAADEGRR